MSDITPMAAVPSEVNYGRIRANFVATAADQIAALQDAYERATMQDVAR